MHAGWHYLMSALKIYPVSLISLFAVTLILLFGLLLLQKKLKKGKETSEKLKDIEEIYLGKAVSLKKSLTTNQPTCYEAYKCLKVLLTTYIFEKYGITIKKTIRIKEKEKLEKAGMTAGNIQIFLRIFESLQEVRKDSDRPQTPIALYNEAIGFFLNANASKERVNVRKQEKRTTLWILKYLPEMSAIKY